MITKFLLIWMLTLIAGCAQLTPAGKAYKKGDECLANITKTSIDVQRVDRELIPDSKTPPEIKYELLNSTERIRDDQKKSMGIYMMLVMQCQDELVINLTGTPLAKAWQKRFDRVNSQMRLLQKGDITIGEYNTADTVDSKHFGSELQSIYQSMYSLNAIDQVNASRMFGSPATTYIAPSAPTSRGITTLGEPPPAYVPPVQTFCQPNGVGGFSCTSR